MWPACQRCLWLWRHRTKTIGGLGIAAGAMQYQLVSHPEVHLPHQGTILMGFGALVAFVGTYNSVAEFFGWRDAPSTDESQNVRPNPP